MVPVRLRKAFVDNPEYLLALVLSAPSERAEAFSSIAIEFTEAEATAKVQRPARGRVAPQLLATKEAIYRNLRAPNHFSAWLRVRSLAGATGAAVR